GLISRGTTPHKWDGRKGGSGRHTDDGDDHTKRHGRSYRKSRSEQSPRERVAHDEGLVMKPAMILCEVVQSLMVFYSRWVDGSIFSMSTTDIPTQIAHSRRPIMRNVALPTLAAQYVVLS